MGHRVRPRSGRATLALAAGALLLSGCTLTGDITVNPDTTLSLDVVVTHTADTRGGACRDLDELREYGVQGELLGSEAGQLSCRYTGTMERTPELAYIFGFIGQGDGRYYVTIPTGVTDAGPDELEAVDLTVHFPGAVLDAPGATVSGNSARWTRADVVRGTGILVTALDHRGVHPSWVIAGTAAAVGTAAGAGAVLLVLRRRARTTAASPLMAPAPLRDGGSAASSGSAGETTPATSPASAAAPGDDPTVWARPD